MLKITVVSLRDFKVYFHALGSRFNRFNLIGFYVPLRVPNENMIAAVDMSRLWVLSLKSTKLFITRSSIYVAVYYMAKLVIIHYKRNSS